MQSIKPVLNRLTLRLATGFTGNISRAVSPQLIINLLDDYRNVANNVYHIGSISSPPNPNLRWEKTKDMKVALDFGLFNDRLTGIIEGYYRVGGTSACQSAGETDSVRKTLQRDAAC